MQQRHHAVVKSVMARRARAILPNMRRGTALTVTLLLALALTTGATLTVVRPVAARPVYTVAQVQARLARRPVGFGLAVSAVSGFVPV